MARPVTSPGGSDPRLLQLADGDNVLIVTAPIASGQRFMVDGQTVEASMDLNLGFKVAATDLDEGDIAVRYGMPIGKATSTIGRGELMHTHNLASLRMRTHARGEA